MEEPPEEAPAESLEHESTAAPSSAGHTNGQAEDHQNNQAKGEAEDQTDHRIAGQSARKVSGQAELTIFGQADDKVSEGDESETSGQADGVYAADLRAYNQVGQRSFEQTEGKASSQAYNEEQAYNDGQESGLTGQRTPERRSSTLSNRKASRQTDHRMSAERISEQIDNKLPMPSDQGAYEQTGHRMSGQAERRIPEEIDQRTSGLANQGTFEQYDLRSSGLVDHKTPAKTHYRVYGQSPKLPERQADQLPVYEAGSGETDQVYSVEKQYDHTEDHQAYYGTLGRFDNSKNYKEDDYRVQPNTFEYGQTDFNAKLSHEVKDETESTTITQAYNPVDAKSASTFQRKSQGFSQRIPSIPSTLTYISGKGRLQDTETNLDDFQEFQQKKKSRLFSQVYQKRFPSVVYEDPYEVSLRYMEKHGILQIFQITENLVYEKPEDPLNFMLYQVCNGSKKATFLFPLLYRK
nr:uncharacterized protein C3orf30 homolog isoform X2 [Microcebus murinus]